MGCLCGLQAILMGDISCGDTVYYGWVMVAC